MDGDTAPHNALPTFVRDAQRLLCTAQDCLAHLQLISNDADACRCLHTALNALVVRAALAGVDEITQHAATLQHLLTTACQQRRLNGPTLPRVEACLILLAWQLELLDPQTGRLDLDDSEQTDLLDELAATLHTQGLHTCALCREDATGCEHTPTPTLEAYPTTLLSTRLH